MRGLALSEAVVTLNGNPPAELETRVVTHSPRGRRLNKPARLSLPKPQSLGEQRFQDWVVEALVARMPGLVEFVLRSTAASELARRLMRSNSHSKATLYQYVYGLYRYCSWSRKTAEQIIAECMDEERMPIPRMIAQHVKLLEGFVGELVGQVEDGTLTNYVKGAKALYRAHGLKVELPYKLSRRVKYKDRAPRPEELQKLLDIADLREKVIVTALALGAFRVGTLVRLTYGHVREDLERGTVPIHVHVEAEIVKGKYGDYDTFLGGEAPHYLKLYIEQRRSGSPEGRTPPEDLVDDSPLIRDTHSATPRAVSEGRIHNILHELFRRAGLISQSPARRYTLRPHTLRKYFKTWLEHHGMKTDYVEYMMGHKSDIYNDVQALGIEFLRGEYIKSGLSIRPPSQVSKLEMLKAFARGIGLDPERILSGEALSEPHRTVVGPDDMEAAREKAISLAIKRELVQSIGRQETVHIHA